VINIVRTGLVGIDITYHGVEHEWRRTSVSTATLQLFVFVNFSSPGKCCYFNGKENGRWWKMIFDFYICRVRILLSDDFVREARELCHVVFSVVQDLTAPVEWMRALNQPVWAFIKDPVGGARQLDVTNQFANPQFEAVNYIVSWVVTDDRFTGCKK